MRFSSPTSHARWISGVSTSASRMRPGQTMSIGRRRECSHLERGRTLIHLERTKQLERLPQYLCGRKAQGEVESPEEPFWRARRMDGERGVRWRLHHLSETVAILRNLEVVVVEDEADGEDADGLEDEGVQEEEERGGRDVAPVHAAEPLEESFADSLGCDPGQCAREDLVDVQAVRVGRVLDGPSEHGNQDKDEEDEERHGEVEEEVREAEGRVRRERLRRGASDKVRGLARGDGGRAAGRGC